MKNAGILVGFLPLIVYGVIAGSSVASVNVALGAALIVTVITGWAPGFGGTHSRENYILLRE